MRTRPGSGRPRSPIRTEEVTRETDRALSSAVSGAAAGTRCRAGRRGRDARTVHGQQRLDDAGRGPGVHHAPGLRDARVGAHPRQEHDEHPVQEHVHHLDRRPHLRALRLQPDVSG